MTVESLEEYLPLARCRAITGLSDATFRRALRSRTHPLPYVRITLGDPQKGKILVRRVDLEVWLASFAPPLPQRIAAG